MPIIDGSSGIVRLDLGNWSQLDFSGGGVYQFSIGNNASAVFSGGRIGQISSYQTVGWLDWKPVGQHIEMICKNYDYNTTTKKLTGLWGNDTTFNIQLVDVSGYDLAINNIKFTIIPEPATLVLLGFGAVISRKKRKVL